MNSEMATLTYNDQKQSFPVRFKSMALTVLCDDYDPALHILGMEGFKVLWFGDPLTDFVVGDFDLRTKTITVTARETIGPRTIE